MLTQENETLPHLFLASAGGASPRGAEADEGTPMATDRVKSALTLMPSERIKPRTIDEYLAGVDTKQRAALARLRKAIQAAAPKAEECISYGLAAFRLDGRPLVAFGATANHCAFYPMSGSTVETYRAELKDFETSKGTVRFSPEQPLPAALVKKLVKARIAENTR